MTKGIEDPEETISPLTPDDELNLEDLIDALGESNSLTPSFPLSITPSPALTPLPLLTPSSRTTPGPLLAHTPTDIPLVGSRANKWQIRFLRYFETEKNHEEAIIFLYLFINTAFYHRITLKCEFIIFKFNIHQIINEYGNGK